VRVIPKVLVFVVGCGGTTEPLSSVPQGSVQGVEGSTSDAFPVGTYGRCFEVIHDMGQDSIGFQSTLTLVQDGSTVTATVNQYETSSFEFSLSTSTSGSLLSTTVLAAAAGTLTYEDGAVFVTVEGNSPADATPPSVWLVCDELQGGAPSAQPVPIPAPPATPQLLAGDYACNVDVATNYDQEYVGNAGLSRLVVTQSGSVVTAQYGAGDIWAAGTLLLTATSARTATVEAGQSLTTSCTVPLVNGLAPSPTQAPLPITAGSLAVDGSTLFLSVEGTVGADSSCSGAWTAITLRCQKGP
jgi:hypothetical protein